MKSFMLTFLKNFSVLICTFLVLNTTVWANTISTTGLGDGKWSSATTWSSAQVPTKDDNITINHTVNLDANWGPQNSGSVTFNATSSGSGTLNMSGGTLDIRANVTLSGGGINLNGGTIYVRSGYTLTMPGFSEASTHIVVEAGATIIINGNLLNNQGNIQVDGLITINGNYNGQANNAIVTGNGDITSTGYMAGINNSSIFGTQNPYCPSNCDGRNLFGGGSCNGTATATPNATSICLGASVSWTSSLTGGYTNNQPLVYQWQIKNSSNLYVNISGATNSTYTVSPAATSEYRVLIGDKQNSSDAYCYKYSPSVSITVTACPKTWIGGTVGNTSDWHTAGNWSPSGVPSSANNVVISSGTYYPVIASGSTAAAKDITINNGASLTFSSNSTLNVYGSISNAGTVTTVSGSSISMLGSTSQTINGLSSVHDLSINNSNGSGVSLLSNLTVNGSLSLISGILTTNNHLMIQFDGGGNIKYNTSDAGSINGNVSGRRSLIAKSHYIAAPFIGVTTDQINASTPIYRASSGVWLLATKKYDTQSWVFIKNLTTTLSPASGYSLTMFDPATLTMTGSYVHTASYSSGDYINTIPAGVTKGMYFMMGNPYPSTLDWESATGWTKTNIDNAIYFWNPEINSVASYVSGVGTNSATQYIPAMQSFFVKVTGSGGMASLAVNNNARVLTSATYYRTSNQLARLIIRNAAGTSADETIVRMDDLATDDFDSDVDAYKITGALSLYTKTLSGNSDYSINTLPITGPEILVPLNLKVAVSGLYTLECSEYSIPGYSMILEDRVTQSYTFMDNSTTYTINANNTDSTNRFVLRFVAGLTTGVTNANSSDLKISTYDNQLMLNAGRIQTDNATINIYDVSGMDAIHLENQSIVPGIQTMTLPGLKQGVYIVKIEIDGATYIGKIVVK